MTRATIGNKCGCQVCHDCPNEAESIDFNFSHAEGTLYTECEDCLELHGRTLVSLTVHEVATLSPGKVSWPDAQGPPRQTTPA